MTTLGEYLADRAIQRAAERADDVFLEGMEALLREGASEGEITEALTGRYTYWADVWREYLEIKHAGQAEVSDPPGTVPA